MLNKNCFFFQFHTYIKHKYKFITSRYHNCTKTFVFIYQNFSIQALFSLPSIQSRIKIETNIREEAKTKRDLRNEDSGRAKEECCKTGKRKGVACRRPSSWPTMDADAHTHTWSEKSRRAFSSLQSVRVRMQFDASVQVASLESVRCTCLLSCTTSVSEDSLTFASDIHPYLERYYSKTTNYFTYTIVLIKKLTKSTSNYNTY